MAMTDLSLDDLRVYSPNLPVPLDLDEFWAATLAESRALGWSPVLTPVTTGLTLVDTYDVTFAGFEGQPVRAWLHVPAGVDRPLPSLVRYLGYGGGRGLAHEVSAWTLAGYACLTMDTRGQGSAWAPGDTADSAGSLPAYPGFMTRGVADPLTYYYRRLYTDAVLAVDAVRTLPMVDAACVSVTGHSQGGGLALAVSALVTDIAAVMPDVPFLCDFPRAAQIADTEPYVEIVRYLRVHREQVQRAFATLAYFDCAVLVRRSSAAALFSVALMDQICPPSTVYAAFNAYGGPKQIVEYPFNDHEGGEAFHQAAQLRWLGERLTA